MDEMYDVPDDLLEDSVDTLASPTKRALHDSDDEDEPGFGRALARQSIPEDPPFATSSSTHRSNYNDGDSDDEPPEIPGSPMKPITAPSYLNDGHKADILVVEHKDDESASSSSEEEYEQDKQSTKLRSTLRSQERPKETVTKAPSPLKPDEPMDDPATTRTATTSIFPPIDSPPKQRQPSPQKPWPVDDEYCRDSDADENEDEEEGETVTPLPPEIRAMLQFVDVFKPEVFDLPMYLEPFVPEYIPSIGSPFEGTSVLRPDVLTAEATPTPGLGVHVLAEPGATQSNPAELQLLLQADAKTALGASRQALELPVHAITDAHLFPDRISAWISSVSHVHASQPAPHVVYTKPMPSFDTLLELWPEALEPMMQVLPTADLQVSLHDFARIVCVLLDIPVYPGQLKQSLHVLFTLYQECDAIANPVR
ncbi:hypothetical protein ACHHYP_09405 [Achlya hypogyna]|uniref:Intraflagellar transport protein 46 n=1 Tax=Achlya hypogyna TaxID=1202772 RepID=A0A1V9YN49_ACHHY|nr:hypothetical protein ACHHYP_09405 [Achlya hypogyna]